MCRLLALIGKQSVKADYWFFDADIPFKDFSQKVINLGPHNSGWGIAWLTGKWNIFKQGKDDIKKYNFSRIRKVNSKIILIYLRHASVGSETTINAHPFNYKNYVFAHNGGVAINQLSPYLNKKFKKQLKTDTDSEVYFLLIMQFLEKTGNIIKAIKKTLSLVKKYPYRGLNFIMSDASNVYAFRDVSPSRKDLYDYYCLNYLIKKDEVVISSDPLSKDNWHALNLGELLIVDNNLDVKKLKV